MSHTKFDSFTFIPKKTIVVVNFSKHSTLVTNHLHLGQSTISLSHKAVQ